MKVGDIVVIGDLPVGAIIAYGDITYIIVNDVEGGKPNTVYAREWQKENVSSRAESRLIVMNPQFKVRIETVSPGITAIYPASREDTLPIMNDCDGFAAGTGISMADGSEKRIEDVNV